MLPEWVVPAICIALGIHAAATLYLAVVLKNLNIGIGMEMCWLKPKDEDEGEEWKKGYREEEDE